MKKRLILFLTLAFIGSFAALWYSFFHTSVISQKNGVVYYLAPGTSKKKFIAELEQQNILRHPALLSVYAYFEKSAYLRTGEYLFPYGATRHSIWEQVTTGKGVLYHTFTIIPGWTFTQLRQALAKANALKPLSTTLNDQQIMARLGHAELAPEGEFFPDTYYYTRETPDLAILKRAYDLMQRKLQIAWQQRDMTLPYKNVYEALTAASLIEKEAYLNSERPTIAGVMINRLNKDMLLQIDATVIYGLGARYDGKIYKENLLADTPYNTYVHKGLPPTPIAMPGMDSLNAVMHPQKHDYFYYVAKGDGGHQFSKTLIEHTQAVLALSKRPLSYFNESKIRFYLYNQPVFIALRNVIVAPNQEMAMLQGPDPVRYSSMKK